jgi:ribosome assembly protein YihI (activator of Der GTPase)
MTRKKKSRKIGQIGVRKQDARPEKSTPNIRKKKAPKGQKSGTRNSMMEENAAVTSNTSQVKKDPKVGSKKKIELVKTTTPEPKKPVHKPNKAPEVKLTKVQADVLSPEQEFAELENDARLIDLAERTEAGELLTGKDAKYFNKNMARYDELCEILGIEFDEEDEHDDLGGDQWDDLLKD